MDRGTPTQDSGTTRLRQSHNFSESGALGGHACMVAEREGFPSLRSGADSLPLA